MEEVDSVGLDWYREGILCVGAWLKAQTSILDLEVMDMRVIVHATRVEAPTEKASVEKEKQKLVLGNHHHSRAPPWGTEKKKPRKKHKGRVQ